MTNLPLVIQSYINFYERFVEDKPLNQDDLIDRAHKRLGKSNTYIIAYAFKRISGEEVYVFDNGKHAYIGMNGYYYDIFTMSGKCRIKTRVEDMVGYDVDVKAEINEIDEIFESKFSKYATSIKNTMARRYLEHLFISIPENIRRDERGH